MMMMMVMMMTTTKSYRGAIDYLLKGGHGDIFWLVVVYSLGNNTQYQATANKR